MSWVGMSRAAAVLVIGYTTVVGAEATSPVAITEAMDATEIAMRLMANDARADSTALIENEWGDEALVCTPIESRGVFYDEDAEVVRRPRLDLRIHFELASRRDRARRRRDLRDLGGGAQRPDDRR